MFAPKNIYSKTKKSNCSSHFVPKAKAIEPLFSNIQLEQVKDELKKWFDFGLAGNGKQIADLTPKQVESFKTEFPQLISSLYNYHCSRRREASNGV